MRELKFRVWSNRIKSFLSEEYLQQYEVCIACIGQYIIQNILYQKEKTGKDLIVQQYTGLQDKHGKDIYEGDIVSYEAGEPNRIDGSFYKSISEVKFKNGAFWPRPMKEECEDSWYDYELKNICIIGNIFESPELLK